MNAKPSQGAAAGSREADYRGRVVDEHNRPIAGAKVALIGITLSSVTDAAGGFTLKSAAPRPLEITADGFFAQTLIPTAACVHGLVVELNSTASPVEGQQVDVARFEYSYRADRLNNPPETRWLPPYNTPMKIFNPPSRPEKPRLKESPLERCVGLLRGSMWDERRRVNCVQVEFSPDGGEAPNLKRLNVITTGVFGDTTYWGHWWNVNAPSAEREVETLARAGQPTKTQDGNTALTFKPAPSNEIDGKLVEQLRDVVKVAVYSGVDQAFPVPAVHVYAEGALWGKPRTVEIEWGVGKALGAFEGRIEAWNGFVGEIEPLADGQGLEMLGAHHWRDPGETSGRRGIRVRTYGPNDGSLNVTVWLGDEGVTFAPSDLADGPLLVADTGVCVVAADSGVTGVEFHKLWLFRKQPTLRQRIREHDEQSWRGAMGAYYDVDKLPCVPWVAPNLSPMQVDVPEKELVEQWRLGGWHLTRHVIKLNERMRKIAIWPTDTSTGYLPWIAFETFKVIEVLDLLGLHDVAEDGLNGYFLASQEERDVDSGFTEFSGYTWIHPTAFTDNDGYMCRKDAYDTRHPAGHGLIMLAAARHCRLVGDDLWLKEAAPGLRKACQFSLRQNDHWNKEVPKESIFYGLLPPTQQNDFYGESMRIFFPTSILYCAGALEVAERLVAGRIAGGAELLQASERWREDLRAKLKHAASLRRALKVGDGSYRRYLSYSPFSRRSPRSLKRYDLLMECMHSSLLAANYGIMDRGEPFFQGVMDVIEEQFLAKEYQNNPMPPEQGPVLESLATEDAWFNFGGHGPQTGWNQSPDLYLLLDDVPLFLRALYNSYAVDIEPANGYTFWEHPFRTGARDKVHGEAAFLERVRNMLVMEIGDTLWLARATPRAWLKQGGRIAVKNAPTYFGTVAYEIVSDVDNGKIDATVEMPAREAPQELALRFRHPQAAPIKSVTVNGKPWAGFDKDKEAILMKGLTGAVAVSARY